MGEAGIKALVIGFSLFLTMTVVSLVMVYFNASKALAEHANSRVDIAESFDSIVNNSETFEQKITGTETKSLIRKYAGSSDVVINIIRISGYAVSGYNNINNTWIDAKTGIVKETMLSIINPAWQNRVYKKTSGKQVILNIELDVKIDVE